MRAKDGSYVSATKVTRIDCDKCGDGVIVSKWPTNDRETYELMNQHMRDKHGGRLPYGEKVM